MAKLKFKIREKKKIENHGMVQSVIRAAQFKMYMVLVLVYPKFRAQMFVCNFTVTQLRQLSYWFLTVGVQVQTWLFP